MVVCSIGIMQYFLLDPFGLKKDIHANPVSYTHLDVYKRQPVATASNATVDYSPKNGIFALDKSEEALQELKEELVDNDEDSTCLLYTSRGV